MVTMLVFFVVVVALDVLASRFGHDSRLDVWSDEHSRSAWR